MTENLTTRELFDFARDIRPHIDALNETYEDALRRYKRAKDAFEETKARYAVAEARAFTKAADERKAAAELAKRIALQDPDVLELQEEVNKCRRVMDEADAQAQAARVGSSRYSSLLDYCTSISNTLNREIKTFASVGGDGYR